MTRTRRTYDLIVFALTDSVVKVSPMSQLRLENYLFTEESVRRAYALLNDHGDLLFYNAYRQPWVYEKIAAMLTRATGAPPRVLFQNGTVLMLSAEKDAARLHPDLAPPPPDLPTDDWPFLYLLRRGIPGVYLRAMALVAACALGLLAFMRKRAARIPELARLPASVPLAFLFMGTAFSLLETKSVIQFSLLFGTTWVNNSLVFLTVLLLVLAANWTAAVLKRKPLWAVYGLLCASCLATLVYPLGRLLEIESTAARLLLASLMTFLPIYFANVLFSASFQNQAAAEYVFGWNLIGAMLGAVIEYASLALGYNALSAIVILCYTATFFLLRGQSIGSSALSDSRRR